MRAEVLYWRQALPVWLVVLVLVFVLEVALACTGWPAALSTSVKLTAGFLGTGGMVACAVLLWLEETELIDMVLILKKALPPGQQAQPRTAGKV